MATLDGGVLATANGSASALVAATQLANSANCSNDLLPKPGKSTSA